MADLQIIDTGMPAGGGTINKPESLHPGRLAAELQHNLGTRLRFNQLTHKPELDGKPMPDQMLQGFYITLGQQGWKIEKSHARDALLYAARQHSYHPIREYLDHLEHDDQVEAVNLTSLATAFLGTADPLYDAMLTATLIGAVARVMEPGCKYDTCCVLRGPQGILKSSFWQALASPAWFCDTPNDDKDLKLAIQTCWIYELAELETKTNRQEAGAIKALLSSSVDSFRVPYGGGIEDHPRPSIFVGSCNRDDFLRDETGSRRFWVIDLPHDPDRGQQIDIAKVRKNRDQIWKAAVLAYRLGQVAVLSPEHQLESNRRNRGFEPEHVWLAPLQRWAESSAPSFFSTDQALIGAGIREEDRLSSQDARCAAGILRDLGYQQDRHQTRNDGGKRARQWRRASDVSDPPAASETGQTNCSAIDQKDQSQISDNFMKLPRKPINGRSVGKTSETSEILRQLEQKSAPFGAELRDSRNPGKPVEVQDRRTGRWEPGWQQIGNGKSANVLCIDPEGDSRQVSRRQIRPARVQLSLDDIPASGERPEVA